MRVSENHLVEYLCFLAPGPGHWRQFALEDPGPKFVFHSPGPGPGPHFVFAFFVLQLKFVIVTVSNYISKISEISNLHLFGISSQVIFSIL